MDVSWAVSMAEKTVARLAGKTGDHSAGMMAVM
jgi:hypothetical protein